MQPLLEESTQGVSCPKCGWSVVTTHISEIKLDTVKYEVHINKGNYRNEEHIKAVSKISGMNFLSARKVLKETQPLVFKGEAIDILQVRKTLVSAGLGCLIYPEFPW